MMKVYVMLSVVGWIWTALFFIVLPIVWFLRWKRAGDDPRRGFEVAGPNEEQH